MTPSTDKKKLKPRNLNDAKKDIAEKKARLAQLHALLEEASTEDVLQVNMEIYELENGIKEDFEKVEMLQNEEKIKDVPETKVGVDGPDKPRGFVETEMDLDSSKFIKTEFIKAEFIKALLNRRSVNGSILK